MKAFVFRATNELIRTFYVKNEQVVPQTFRAFQKTHDISAGCYVVCGSRRWIVNESVEGLYLTLENHQEERAKPRESDTNSASKGWLHFLPFIAATFILIRFGFSQGWFDTIEGSDRTREVVAPQMAIESIYPVFVAMANDAASLKVLFRIQEDKNEFRRGDSGAYELSESITTGTMTLTGVKGEEEFPIDSVQIDSSEELNIKSQAIFVHENNKYFVEEFAKMETEKKPTKVKYEVEFLSGDWTEFERGNQVIIQPTDAGLEVIREFFAGQITKKFPTGQANEFLEMMLSLQISGINERHGEGTISDSFEQLVKVVLEPTIHIESLVLPRGEMTIQGDRMTSVLSGPIDLALTYRYVVLPFERFAEYANRLEIN